MPLYVLCPLHLANAAQKGRRGTGDNRQSHRVARCSAGNLGAIPAVAANECFLQHRRAGQNKMIRIPGALRVRRSNYRDRENPGQVFRARARRTFPGVSRYFPRKCHASRKTRNREETKGGNRNQLPRPSGRCLGCGGRRVGKRWSRWFRLNCLEAPSSLQFCFRISRSNRSLPRAGDPELAHLEKTSLPLTISS